MDKHKQINNFSNSRKQVRALSYGNSLIVPVLLTRHLVQTLSHSLILFGAWNVYKNQLKILWATSNFQQHELYIKLDIYKEKLFNKKKKL
jgi:hypothetical protein